VLRRLLLITAAAVVLLIVVVAGAAYWFFARDGFRQALESQATSWLGHPVHIGAAHAQFLPRLAVSLGTFASATRRSWFWTKWTSRRICGRFSTAASKTRT
jgi:hypothetical protein